MGYKKSDKCICGHGLFDHEGDNGCFECWMTKHTDWCEKFQLSNLDYIERLAKERGLV